MTIFEELRHAARSLARSKGFALSASLTLALALGLTAPIFGVIDQILHPYTPIEDAERVVVIQPIGGPRSVTAFDRYLMMRSGTRFAEGMVPVVRGSMTVETPTLRVLNGVAIVPPEFFPLLGITPTMGRLFASGNESDAVVLGNEAWQQFFPSRNTVAGATITIEGHTYAVIGVVPDRTPGGIFLATDATRPPTPPGRWVMVYARLKSGVQLPQVAHDLGVIAHQVTVDHGELRRPARFEISPAGPSSEALFGGFVYGYAAVGFCILAIACANLANLMLVRGAARRREIALKMALGSSRFAVVRQFVIEAIMVAVLGAGFGVPLSVWAIQGFRYGMPILRSRYDHFEPHMGWRTIAFLFVAAAVTGIIVGVFPALRASEVSLDEPLKESGGGLTARAKRRHTVLAIVELALALPLLMQTGLAIRATIAIANFNFGFDDSRVLMGNVYLSQRDTQSIPPVSQVLSIASSVPGVLSASLLYPPAGGTPVQPDIPLPPQRLESTRIGVGGPGFEATLGLKILMGRGFEEGDIGQHVVIVNQTAARRLWGEGINPIGHLLNLGIPSREARWWKVIGVMQDANIAFTGLNTPSATVMKPPYQSALSSLTLAIRADGSSDRVAADVSRELSTRLGLRAPAWVMPWERATSFAALKSSSSVSAVVVGVFSACALGLATVGLYGVLAFAVGQRRREFAVRMALGATREGIGRSVLRHALVIVLGGTAVGGFLAIVLARIIGMSRFTTIETVDVVPLIGAELVLCLVAFLACLGPARRAMKADPAEILRAV